MNKRFFKSLKLYLKTVLNPIMIAMALIMLAGIPIGIIADPVPIGDKEYMDMIGTVGVVHIGIVFIQMIGCLIFPVNKFFLSIPDAKRYYTIIPVMLTVVLSLVYDAVVLTIGFCLMELQTVSDLMLICSVCTVLSSTVAAALNKKGLALLNLFACLILFSTVFVFKGEVFVNGFGVPFGAAAVIAPLILIAGTLLNLFVMRAWWKKSDRVNGRVTTVSPLSLTE